MIVGAGAAGIAAARRIAAAGRKFVLLEAADHIGGRCITETRTFGVPYDRGAHWIHTPDLNPVTKLQLRRGIEVYPAPASQKVRIGRRYAREGELEDFLASQVRANRAIADAARKADVACAQALPNDLGDWRPSVEFVLGPFGCGKELAQVSAVDFAKSAERNTDAFCRQGFGTLIAALAEGIAVKLSTPATVIDTRRNVAVETPKGAITARAAIVTVIDQRDQRRAPSNSRPSFPSGSSTPSPSSRSAATTTLRSNSPAIRSASRATIWCSRSRRTPAPPQSSPTSPARRFA